MSASDTPKRYTQTSGAIVESFNTFDGKPSGDWIKASDYDDLRERLAEVEAALEYLLAKCPNCGGTGMVETGRIQFGYPSDSPCGLCSNERKVFDAALQGVKK